MFFSCSLFRYKKIIFFFSFLHNFQLNSFFFFKFLSFFFLFFFLFHWIKCTTNATNMFSVLFFNLLLKLCFKFSSFRWWHNCWNMAGWLSYLREMDGQKSNIEAILFHLRWLLVIHSFIIKMFFWNLIIFFFIAIRLMDWKVGATCIIHYFAAVDHLFLQIEPCN